MSALHAVVRPATGPAQGLVVLLHGVGSNERSLLGLAQGPDPRLQVALPRAPLAFGPDAFGWFSVRFGAQGPVIDPGQAEASRQLLIDYVRRLQAQQGVDAAHTLVAGFSQGGIMSAGVALTAPRVAQRFAVLSGRILPEIAAHIPADIAAHGVQGLILHGEQDSKLPFALATAASARLQALGVQHALHGYPADHTLTPAMQADFHAWSARQLLAAA
ncbi:dienelactone hydrolase family protein [Stenotrophomonas sp. BIGb0135]|uniref:alpha/beta hydrolase n=1 Tax=Stenotrophomonas sp. BIGb0135 TaxID=2940620 RepID=UPI0021694963|nr:dienelactone hydrolase family protein [Stenotrophomonas sp. BIGb0135]MCS4235417.1 phospholipase/carboxylesterase [Stenotrophomonas sp. BIGb0135]